MLKIRYHHSFKKDYKHIKKSGLDVKKLEVVVKKLTNGEELDEKYHVHEWTGNYRNFRECHIEPDWLLIYRIENEELTFILSRTGTHIDLF